MRKTFRARTRAGAGGVLVASALACVVAGAVVAQDRESPAAAGQRIGKESLIGLPQRALWNRAVNFRPGDGDVEHLNPPPFSWCYTPDPLDLASDQSVKEFQFQVAYDKDFRNLVVDVRTGSNLYNFLAPFKQKTCYWRVGYVDPKKGKAPYAWSRVRTFKIADDAVVWDRSMLADAKYLNSKAAHPRLIFTPSTRDAIRAYMAERHPETLRLVKLAADKALTAPWWSDPQPKTTAQLRDIFDAFLPVPLAFQLTGDKKYQDPRLPETLVKLTRKYVELGATTTDWILSGDNHRPLAYSYDWLYDVMTDAQRKEVASALGLHCRWILKDAWWLGSPKWGSGDPTGEYANPCMRIYNGPKNSTSHAADLFVEGMIAALAVYGENEDARALLQTGMHAMIGRPYFVGSEDGCNEGESYVLEVFSRTLMTHMLYQVVFPEARFDLNPFFRGMAEWWSRIEPVGIRQILDPWGDGGIGGTDPVGTWLMLGPSLSHFTADGRAMKHWKELTAYSPRMQQLSAGRINYNFTGTPLLWHFSSKPLVEEEWKNLGRVFPMNGWAMGATYSPNTRRCYDDGVGFVFACRPCGTSSHAQPCDLSFKIWAYGSTIAQSGAGYCLYGDHPMSRDTILVDGFGQLQSFFQQEEPFYSRIFAFRETPQHIYCAGDATRAYPHRDLVPRGMEGGQYDPNVYDGKKNNLSHVQKVRRHVLFVRKKYFVMYDDLASEKPVRYSWLYHVRENTLALDSTHPASFEYTAGEVSTKVVHVAFPDGLELRDMQGSQVCSNPLTGEDYQSVGGEGARFAHALWLTNKTPRKDWHFMTVIYPQKPGGPAPEIKRLDDFTVEVVYGGEKDVISFDPRTKHPATLIVDLPAMEPLPVRE